ncbi:MAG: site-2 protease family protein [Halobaculum sp.]
MGYNYTVARVWGIPIRVNVSLLVFLPILTWLIASGGQIEAYAGAISALTGEPLSLPALRAGFTPWVIGGIAAFLLFFAVTLHELGHSWVALRYGIEIESITLWILGGLASLKSVPREASREFWIAVAGPIVSLGLAAVGWVVVQLLPGSSNVIRFLAGWFALTNLTLAVFNMLPAFPMDGGRVLRAVLARNRSYPTATRIASRVGVAFAVLFVVVGVTTGQLLMLLLALFVYTAATGESRAVMLGDLLEGFTAGDVASRDVPTLDPDTTVAAFTDRMMRDRRTVYPVTGRDGAVGIVSLSQLRNLEGDRDRVTLGEIAGEARTFDATDAAFDCLMALGRDEAALVTEGDRVVGVLTREDFAQVLALMRGDGPGPRVAA